MRVRGVVIVMVLCSLEKTLAYIVPGFVVLGAGAAFFGKPLYCLVKECCNDRWIPLDFRSLKNELHEKVFGQHIAVEVVYRAIKGHALNKNPEKALVLSFHGWTGCGKNHISRIIADNLFKLGMNSKYTHQIIATHDFPHKDKVRDYKDNLRSFIIEKVTQCPRTLFIFDEVDKVPSGLIDTLRPYLEHHRHVNGIDYRKSIFIFLSNTGSKMINNFVIEHYSKGNKREDLTVKDMERIINNGAFNMEGGLWHSELISHNLIDLFVPIMPLEKIHVKKCIRVSLKQRECEVSEDIVNEVADQMQYDNTHVFSTTGCKKVATRVDKVIQGEKDVKCKKKSELLV